MVCYSVAKVDDKIHFNSLKTWNWCWQFFCLVLSSCNLNGFCYWYAWYCSLCEGCASFCTELFFWKLGQFLLMFSTCFTSFSVFRYFHLSITFFVSMNFSALSSNLDEVLLITVSTNVFFFGDLSIIKTG